MFTSLFRHLLSGSASRKASHSRRPAQRRPECRLEVERLEVRELLSGVSISISDVTVREGPTSLGILDPSGAASVGVSGIRGIVLDSTPGHPHSGDMFVTGWISHSVARFDWASQTYQPFVAPDSGGLGQARGIAVGPDGDVYVSDQAQNIIFRYDGSTGAPSPASGQTGAVFVPAGSGGLSKAADVSFGPDGNLYVCSNNTNQILEYQGPAGSSPGAFMRVFVSVTNASSPANLTFGPDGNLYVSLYNAGISAYGQVNRYDGATGAPIGTGVFVPLASGGLIQPRGIVFDPQGTNMYVVEDLTGNGYVSSMPRPMGQVLRFQGPNGQNPGAYVDAYVTGGQAGLSIPIGLARDAAGNLYVSDRDTANVTRFAPGTQAAFTVTLDSASGGQVSVNYATANSLAVSGADYGQTSGALVFAPGVTAQTINVPIVSVATGGPTKTFTLNLSGASGATINRGQGTGSILNRLTKFFVVDSGTVKTYEYGSGGTSEEITVPQLSTNTAPRGAASTAAGTAVWVVDANKTVYVYNNHGVLLGSWTTGSLASNAQVEGIATNGADIWLVDNTRDKVYKYTNAASRLSGSQNAASSFNLKSGASGNTNPKDIVTDGTSLWVVNDSTTDKVFKYTVAGALVGSWTIDAANSQPTGITIDPSNVSNIWIVDSGADKVFQYTAAASRTSGILIAAMSFALAAGNTNPQGIADPPAAPIEALAGADAWGTTGDTQDPLLMRFSGTQPSPLVAAAPMATGTTAGTSATTGSSSLSVGLIATDSASTGTSSGSTSTSSGDTSSRSSPTKTNSSANTGSTRTSDTDAVFTSLSDPLLPSL